MQLSGAGRSQTSRHIKEKPDKRQGGEVTSYGDGLYKEESTSPPNALPFWIFGIRKCSSHEEELCKQIIWPELVVIKTRKLRPQSRGGSGINTCEMVTTRPRHCAGHFSGLLHLVPQWPCGKGYEHHFYKQGHKLRQVT